MAFPRYLGSEGVEVFCQQLVEDAGVLLLPASIYRSDLTETPLPVPHRVRTGKPADWSEGHAGLAFGS